MSHLRRWHVALILLFFLAVPGCFQLPGFKWPEGTWEVDVEGWEGELVVSDGGECYVFDLRVVGPDRKVTWRGTVYRAEGGLRLDVFHVNGKSVYPDRTFSRVLQREGDTLSGEVLGTNFTFRKR